MKETIWICKDCHWGPEKTNRNKNRVKNVGSSKGCFPRAEFMGEKNISE
jgi:hypothetical protein